MGWGETERGGGSEGWKYHKVMKETNMIFIASGGGGGAGIGCRVRKWIVVGRAGGGGAEARNLCKPLQIYLPKLKSKFWCRFLLLIARVLRRWYLLYRYTINKGIFKNLFLHFVQHSFGSQSSNHSARSHSLPLFNSTCEVVSSVRKYLSLSLPQDFRL